MNIYVGNLSYEATEEDLREAFGSFGQVDDARIIIDRNTNRSRGFGFVEMPNQAEGQAAIDGVEGTDLRGRPLRVNEARPRSDKPQGGGSRGDRR